jgi:RNA polymerase sigma-70 factor (ECF subfamily)
LYRASVTSPKGAREPADRPGAPSRLGAPEDALLPALRAGDAAAFGELFDRLNGPLLRLARLYASNPAIAEEVVQEAWIGVIKGLERFEGRASLRTWCSRIVINIARTRAEREHRQIPFSAFEDPIGSAGEPAVEPERFLPSTDPQWSGHWVSYPSGWDEVPEERLLAGETLAVVAAAIDRLPPSQREVITLRDVNGWSSDEVCNALEISATNQRVLLHRARARVRHALERHLAPEAEAVGQASGTVGG